VASDSPETAGDAALDELFTHPEQVPLVYWRAFTGTRTVVLLAGAGAVVAFVTGLSHLSQTGFELAGPLAGPLPAGATDPVRLSGVLLAFLLAVATAGLGRGYRVAWYGAVCLFAALVALPLVTGNATDVLPAVLGGVALPLVVRTREEFDRAVDLSPFQTTALLAFVGVQVYGTVGTYALREDFVGVSTVTDAFYYIVVTGTTVGYGDATPTTQLTKLFTLSIIVLGTGAFTVASGSLLIPALESRISSAFGTMTGPERTLLEDHVLVLGYGDLTEPLLDELGDDAVVVTADDDAATRLGEREVSVVGGDPTDVDTLADARIEAAAGVVVATEDDARGTMAIVAARRANPDVRIVAAATDESHVETLREVGADDVVSPTRIGGHVLGRSVRGEDSALDGP
jgi:voltage-gated potassium channel